MIEGAKLNLSMVDLLKSVVCDINNAICMLNNCTECPDPDVLKLQLAYEDNLDLTEQIIYKQ